MRVGIVGGGLAGATLGAALTRKGIAFDLFERASAFEPVGAGIALMPPALTIADKLGLSERVRSAPFADVSLADGKGQASPRDGLPRPVAGKGRAQRPSSPAA